MTVTNEDARLLSLYWNTSIDTIESIKSLNVADGEVLATSDFLVKNKIGKSGYGVVVKVPVFEKKYFYSKSGKPVMSRDASQKEINEMVERGIVVEQRSQVGTQDVEVFSVKLSVDELEDCSVDVAEALGGSVEGLLLSKSNEIEVFDKLRAYGAQQRIERLIAYEGKFSPEVYDNVLCRMNANFLARKIGAI